MIAAMASPLPPYNAMVASATLLPPDRRLTPKYDTWQEQLWTYYESLGEFESAVSWRANTMSRVRLTAAKVEPGGDEPTLVTDGPAAEAVARLAGGTAGQAQLLAQVTMHLTVPGECWVVGETKADDGQDVWSVRSADELRITGRGVYELRDDEPSKSWRPAPANTVVVRIWDPHPRRGWEADPAARHALSAMTKLDLANKRIIAVTVSRLASNGLLLYDKERLSLHTASQNQTGDAASQPAEVDPFAALLVDVASRGIKDPTSPEAVIPIPVGFSIGADIANIRPEMLLRHVTFASDVDERLLAQRQDALRELATALDLPVEALVGMEGLNHWGSWAVEESGIKIHVSPTAELICHALTKGYLRPYLLAAGEDPAGMLVWYDPSELALRPDRSANTLQAYDRLEASGAALRREVGLDEEDEPSEDELRILVLKKQAGMAALSAGALAELTGEPAPAAPAPAGGEGEAPAEVEAGETGPPGTLGEPAPSQTAEPGPPTRASLAALTADELRTCLGDVVSLLAGLEPPVSRWVDPLTPLPALRGRHDGAG